MKRNRKKLTGLIVAIIVIGVCTLLQSSRAPEDKGIMGIGILAASLVLWSTETLPMSVTTMLMICVLAFTNIMSFNDAIANIGVNTSLFIMASSGITIAVGNSSIPRHLTKMIISSTGNNSKKLVVSMGFLIAICSAFMSSLATCALFNSILLPFLHENNLKPGKSKLGKCLMLMIPACAGIGGFMSPAGTPANILLIDLLEINNIAITFGQWCLVGFPIGLIAVGLFSVSLISIFPPEALSDQELEHSGVFTTMNACDKKTVVIVGAVIALWFVSGWVQSLNTTMIAVIGMSVMFMPGIELLDWDKFSDGVNWDLVLTMGTVSVLMTGIARTGVMNKISTTVLSGIGDMPLLLSMICVSLSICIIRAFVPTTTAVVALLAPMLIELSSATGFSILNLLLILGFWTASALLIVYTEPIYLITFGNRYYRGADLLKAGLVPCVLLSVITVLLIPFITQMIM